MGIPKRMLSAGKEIRTCSSTCGGGGLKVGADVMVNDIDNDSTWLLLLLLLVIDMI